MVKRIISVMLCITVLCSLATFSMFNTNAVDVSGNLPYKPADGVETVKIYFYMPQNWYNEYNKGAGVIWNKGDGAVSKWKDMYSMYSTKQKNIYYADIPVNVPFVIFTNMLDIITEFEPQYEPVYAQTSNVVISKNNYAYEEKENIIYPSGLSTKDLDGKIYVVNPDKDYKNVFSDIPTALGDWFYYYGNGEYGVSEKRDENTVHTGEYYYTAQIEKDVKYRDSQQTSSEPTTNPTDKFYTYEDFLNYKNSVLGDINNDKKIDISDTTIIQLNLAGYTDSEGMPYISNTQKIVSFTYYKAPDFITKKFILGDWTNDNAVDVKDVTFMQIAINKSYEIT